LYQSAGELLARNGQTDEAVDLLREGITRIPPQSSLSSLYQSAGELLARNGRVDEAVELLREGIARIPPHSNLFYLYQLAGDVLARKGEVDEAVKLLREGIARISPQSGLSSLYQSAGDVLARNGRVAEAVELLRNGIASFPAQADQFAISRQTVMILAQHGQPEEAEDLLRKSVSGTATLAAELSSYKTWVQFLSMTGRHSEAVERLMEGIHIIGPQREAGELAEAGAITIACLSEECSWIRCLRPHFEELSFDRAVLIIDLLTAEGTGDWETALEMATEGGRKFGGTVFRDHEILALAAVGRNDCAANRLQELAQPVNENAGRWLQGYVLALGGDTDGCYEVMAPWVARWSDDATDDPLSFCIRIWKDEIHRPRGGRYPLRFPFLPVLADDEWSVQDWS
ncbi:tetratricopeptide repeat protein, partial [Streptomyces sp. NPDC017936]|uniref:tetratricopeptide repeat protein n=1 Tax=Streptomyces sp. NPDC017936 TaxID=3365016 RepID=UPI0037B87BFF